MVMDGVDPLPSVRYVWDDPFGSITEAEAARAEASGSKSSSKSKKDRGRDGDMGDIGGGNGSSSSRRGQKEKGERKNSRRDRGSVSLQDLFTEADTDNSGSLSMRELKAVLKKWNRDIPKNQLLSIMSTLDANTDGSLSFEEFEQHVGALPAELAALFQRSSAAAELDTATGDDTVRSKLAFSQF